jgi:DNA-binding CsgD family transcriptional regulator
LSAAETLAPPIRITVLAPFLSHDEWYFRGPECVVLLEELKSDLDWTVEEFGQFYKLTGAEMRTVAGLSRGLCLNEISASVGVSVETARAQLKSVFHKSGTHRQAELVALLAQFRFWQ